MHGKRKVSKWSRRFLQLLLSENTLANLSNDWRSFLETLFQDLDNLVKNHMA